MDILGGSKQQILLNIVGSSNSSSIVVLHNTRNGSGKMPLKPKKIIRILSLN